MNSAFSLMDCKLHGTWVGVDWDDGDCSGPYDPKYGIYGDEGTTGALGTSVHDGEVWEPAYGLAEGPIKALPEDLWPVIVTYLSTSEALSLRGTAVAVQKALQHVTGSILDGYRTLDKVMQSEKQAPVCRLESIEVLCGIGLPARAEMMKRYARSAGLARRIAFATGGKHEPEPTRALRTRYFEKHTATSKSEHEKVSTAWAKAIDQTKAALRDMTFDMSCSTALSDLYAADMYAPLLGLVSNPEAHVRQVMDAAEKLSMRCWMDFLYAVEPLIDVCPSISAGYKSLTANFDRRYPMPRIDVLAAIVRRLMMSSGLDPVRDVCLHRMGIDPQCLAESITPSITQSIAEAILSDPLVRGISVAHRLQMYAQRWDNEDTHFAASLHLSFIDALARRAYRGSMQWLTLPESARRTLRTRVLGIAPGDSEKYGLSGRAIFDFWGLYFEIADPNTVVQSPKLASRIDALHWPLQARLWQLSAEGREDPHIPFAGPEKNVFQVLCSKRVDILCTQALMARKPAIAMSALQAVLKWQVIQACESFWRDSKTGVPRRAAECPELSRIAWTAFECCTPAERLTFVAALFSYRDVLTQCGYVWDFQAMISQDVVSFLCDPRNALVCPAQAVVDVLMHYLPLCGDRLPEFALGPGACGAALAKRLDLI